MAVSSSHHLSMLIEKQVYEVKVKKVKVSLGKGKGAVGVRVPLYFGHS